MAPEEVLVSDYSCALQRDILVHGRLYLSQTWLCFYANIFGWETLVTIRYHIPSSQGYMCSYVTYVFVNVSE